MAKRRRSRSESRSTATVGASSSSSRKVCFVSYVHLNGQLKDRFVDVYVFDLDRNKSLDLDTNPRMLEHGDLENVSVPVAPAFRFRSLSHYVATCVVDSKLYLFPGYGAISNPEVKSVRLYDLSSPDPDAESTLCSTMLGMKLEPCAIPTPDSRKIVVFSTRIQQNSHQKGFIDFELYDYVNHTSVELPRIPRGGREYLVLGYYFVNATTLAVITVSDSGGWGLREAYTLDLSRKEEKGSYSWEGSEEGEVVPWVAGYGFQICGGACFVSEFGLYERCTKSCSKSFPHDPKVKEDGYNMRFFLPAPLDNSPNGDEMCICYFERKCRGGARVFINVHRMNPANGFFEWEEYRGKVPAPEMSSGDLGVSRSIANESRKASIALSPGKEDRYYTARGSGAFDDASKALFVNPKEESKKVVWPRLLIPLSSKEKEEDFMAMKGCKPPQRPKKRAKLVQRTILLVSPGSWLSDLCQERYEVREKKTSKKKARGLKGMGVVSLVE